MLTPVAAPEMELPWSKGKGPELGPESEGVQELRRCDSCERRDAECVHIKVSTQYVCIESPHTDNLVDRSFSLLPLMPGAMDLVLHWRWGSGPAKRGVGGGPGRGPIKKGLDGQGPGVGDGAQSPTGAVGAGGRESSRG